MRERVVDAAVVLTTEQGWAQVTMARLADEVGVSRQTVYNEIGTKPRLAEAMILRELDRFLDVVTVAFDDHPDDLVGAIRGGVAGRCSRPRRTTPCCTRSSRPPTARTPSCCRC